MALAIATVADSISDLTVAGLVIKDKDQIPAQGDVRQPILIPKPDFVTEFAMERNSFGAASSKMTVTYTLNYRLLYKPLGDGRNNLMNMFSAMVDMVGLFWDAVLAIGEFTGAVDIVPAGISNMGIVSDPADQPFWGCDVSLMITEFVN